MFAIRLFAVPALLLLAAKRRLHLDFGTFLLGAPIGIPFVTVPGTQKFRACIFSNQRGE